MSSREDEIRAGARAQQASNQTKDEIKRRTVPWDRYARDGTLTDPQVKILQSYDKKDSHKQAEMLNDPNQGSLVAEAVTAMLKTTNVAQKEDIHYVLMLMFEMLEANRATAKLFRELTTVDPGQKLLDVLAWIPDVNITRLASHNLAVLIYPGLGNGCEPEISSHLSNLVENARDVLDPDKVAGATWADVEHMMCMASALMVFLRESHCRKAVNDEFNLHRHLSLFLAKVPASNVQLLYQVGFCLWLLSYDEEIAALMSETDVVVNILKVMKGVSKEKVIRVCMACLRNLVDKASHNQTMIDNDAIKQLAVLRNRKWADDEVREDLDFVSDALAKSVHVLSSLDMYKQELANGQLEWTPVHKSETFWRDNVAKICPVGKSVSDPEADVLNRLIELLNTKIAAAAEDDLDQEEATTVAVICHDLGEFARFHPQGKRILQSDAANNTSGKSTKDLLMSIMSSPPNNNDDIGKQALTCIHKMMVNNWQFLESRSS